jgi:hypothetical protein
MSYRQLQLLFHLLVVGYMAVALVLGLSFYHREIFPVFSWSLFSYVEAHKTEFAVLVTEVDGRQLEAPREFMDSKDLFAGAGNMRAYYTIQNFGWAVMRRDLETVNKLRRLFESEYMKGPARDVKYQVIVRSFDAIERWRGGPYEFRVIGKLERQEGSSQEATP